MIFFNLRGLAVISLACVVAWFSVAYLPYATSVLFFYWILIACLVSSLLSLATDRCDRLGLWDGYRVNTADFFSAITGRMPEGVWANSNRRLAVFGGPLAGAPLLQLLSVLVFWVVNPFQDEINAVPLKDLGVYTIASIAAVLIALAFARLTRGLRVLPGSYSAPANASPPDDLSDYPEAPSRAPAVLATVLGGIGLALACGYLQFFSGGVIAIMVLTACPLVLAVGIGGIIDPRIFYSIRAEGRIYPVWLRAIGVLFAAAGLALSLYLILIVYKDELFGRRRRISTSAPAVITRYGWPDQRESVRVARSLPDHSG